MPSPFDDAHIAAEPATACPGTLVVVAMETMWPANHGGRVDRWNRWHLMKQLGWRLIFVGWSQDDSHEAPEHRAAMATIFDACFFYPNRPSLRSMATRLIRLPRHSPHMSSRHVSASLRRRLVADLNAYQPDAVMMDGLYGADLGMALARDLQLPLFYRSHNIEHRYMRRQFSAAQGWKRKLAMGVASLHLESAELSVMKAARQVFDISADDIACWRSRGIDNLNWLPPLIGMARSAEGSSAEWQQRPYDAVYLGNLNTPNNVEGLAWFIQQVLPILLTQRPDISILIAGSNPSDRLRSLLTGHGALHLLPNPDDVAVTRAMGRVMINPILQGSGVNVKSVEMLFTDSPVVTTTVGVQGLDEETRAAFLVDNDPALFARNMIDALSRGPVSGSARIAACDRFGMGAARVFSNQLTALLSESRG